MWILYSPKRRIINSLSYIMGGQNNIAIGNVQMLQIQANPIIVMPFQQIPQIQLHQTNSIISSTLKYGGILLLGLIIYHFLKK